MAETKQQQEIKKILEQLEGGVKELFESDRYKEFSALWRNSMTTL